MDSKTMVAAGMLTIRQAMSFAALSRSSIYAAMDSGALASVKIGRSRRIPRVALVDFLARLLEETNR